MDTLKQLSVLTITGVGGGLCQEVSPVLCLLLHHWPRAVMSRQSGVCIRRHPPTQGTDRPRLTPEERGRGTDDRQHVQRTRLAAKHLLGEVRPLKPGDWGGAVEARSSHSHAFVVFRAKELKALFGSLLQKSDLTGQAKKSEKLK